MNESIPIVGENPKLDKADTKLLSSRTTMPGRVVNELKEKEGNSLQWEQIIHDGKFAITVKKAGNPE